MKQNNTNKKALSNKFNEAQRFHLESLFTNLSNTLEQIQAISKITKESIIDSEGEQNKEISVYDIANTFSLVENILDSINTELCELSTNANYIYWKHSKKNRCSLWDKVHKCTT